MPDYGDDRGFRSRGVPANIGFDRAGPVPANIGFDRAGPVPANIGFDRVGPVTDQMGGSTHYDPDKIDRLRSEDRARLLNSTPIQSGGSTGEFALPLYSGRNPFIQPIQTGGRLGEFSQGIFGGGSKAYAANDIVDAIMGGMDRAQEPGTDITRYTDDYKVIKRKLWPKAVNKFPPGTPKPVIVQEWERLQEEYWRLKDQQGYRPGVT
jgi:hypothetical protein